jgi:hypothetical protein
VETTTPAEVTAATKSTATARVAATTKPTATESSTSAAMPSRPCYGTERHGRDASYQSNYLFYFHAFKFGASLLAGHCASAGFCGATSELAQVPSFEIGRKETGRMTKAQCLFSASEQTPFSENRYLARLQRAWAQPLRVRSASRNREWSRCIALISSHKEKYEPDSE